jgi:hypothetical protein
VQRRVEEDLRGLLDTVITADFPFWGPAMASGGSAAIKGRCRQDDRYADRLDYALRRLLSCAGLIVPVAGAAAGCPRGPRLAGYGGYARFVIAKGK